MTYLRFFLVITLMFLSSGNLLWSHDGMQQLARTEKLASTDRYRSRSSGNWNASSTWEVSSDNGQTWHLAASTPASGSATRTSVLSGHTVTVTQSVTIDSALVEGQITINAGQTLTIANGSGTDLTVNGTILNQGTFSVSSGANWILNGGGTFIHNSSSGISTALNAAMISSASTFEYRDSGTPSLGGRTYGNLKLTTGVSKTYTNSASSGSLIVGGSLEIGKGVTWNTGGFETDITVQGATTVCGTWTGSGVSNQGTHTFNGPVSVPSGGIYSLATTGAIQGSLNFRSDLVVPGSLSFPPTRSVNFNGTRPQTISGSTILFANGLVVTQNLTVSTGSTIQIASGKVMRVTGDLEVLGSIIGPGSLSFEGVGKTLLNNGSIMAAAVLIPAEAKVSGIGVWAFLTVGSGCAAIIEGEHTLTGAGTPFVTNKTPVLGNNSSIIYRGTSVQTIAPLAYRNITIDNTAGALLILPASVSGALVLRKGGLEVGSNLSLASSALILREAGSLSGTPSFGSTVEVKYEGVVAVMTGPEMPSDTGVIAGLTVNNQGGVTLGRTTRVKGKVAIAGGNLVTGNNVLVLGDSAMIDESAPFSIVGQLRATRTLQAGAKERFGGMGVEINAGVVAPGLTTITRVTGLASTLGCGTSILRYVDIAPAIDTGLAAKLVFHYGERDLNGVKGENLKLFKSTDSGVSWTTIGGTVDVATRSVTVESVNSFSRWTAGESFPVPTLASVRPTSGEPGSSLTVELSGTGFLPGVTTVSFSGPGISVDSFSVKTPTCVLADISISPHAPLGYRNVTVSNGQAGTAVLSEAFEVSAHLNPVPRITGIEPSIGVRGTPLVIRVRGSGFLSGLTTISFGDSIQVKSVAIVEDTSLMATIAISPQAIAGYRDVEVTTSPPGGGRAVLVSGFCVFNPVPTVTNLSATTGQRGKTMGLYVNGSGFIEGVTTATFGSGIVLNSLSVRNSSQLYANITLERDAVIGPRDVSVANAAPGGGKATASLGFLVVNPSPSLLSVVPSSALPGQSLNVTLEGTDFFDDASSVTFGDGITVNTQTANTSGTQIIAGISIGATAAPGARNLTVMNAGPGGGNATLKSGFTISSPVPTLTLVFPSRGARAETMMVVLNGSGFVAGTTLLNFGTGVTINSITVTSPTQMSVSISIAANATLGIRDVAVSNPAPGGGSATIVEGFVVVNPAPTLISIAPTSGARGETLTIALTGTGFISDVTTFDFGPDLKVGSVRISGATQSMATITISPDAATGTRSFTAGNMAPGGGSSILADAFTITNPAPFVESIWPDKGELCQLISATVRGSGFLSGVTSLTAGDGITVDSVVVDSMSRLHVRLSISRSAPAGSRNVIVANKQPGGGISNLADGFVVLNPQPTVMNVKPVGAMCGQQLTVGVTGTNFVVGQTSISFGKGIVVHSLDVRDATSLQASISVDPFAASGIRDVIVTNPGPGGGSAMLMEGFTVSNPVPVIVSLSLTTGQRGKNYDLLVHGANFVSGATTLNLGPGTVVRSVTINNPTQLFASVSIDRNAAPGSRDVSVVSGGPGGGKSVLQGGFTVHNPPPVLRSIAPATGRLLQKIVLEISGMDFFDGVTSVRMGTGIHVKSISIDSTGTCITASIEVGPETPTGSRDVTVTNSEPGGGIAVLPGAFEVTLPKPTMTGISPLGGVRGQILDVSIAGVGFAPNATDVSFGPGIIVNSRSVVNPTEMTANISIGIDAALGPREVVVSNSPPGGGATIVSNAFTIANPAPSISRVSPLIVIKGQAVDVELVGANFLTDVTSVVFGEGVIVNSIKVHNLNRATVKLSVPPDAIPGSRNITVTNEPPGGGSATLTAGFVVANPPPIFTGITPLVGYRGQNTVVTIIGSSFVPGMTTIDLGPNILVASNNVVDPTQLSSTLFIEPSAVVGPRNVTVKNAAPGGGSAVLANAFTVCNPSPTLTEVSPAIGIRGQSLSINVKGANLIAGTTMINFGGGVALNAFRVSNLAAAMADITVPMSLAPGMRDVSVYNEPPGGGTATLSGAFAVVNPVPTISKVLPDTASPGSRLNITVFGSQFIPGVTSLSVDPDLCVASLNVDSIAMLHAEITVAVSAAPGPRTVTITNAGPGGGSAHLTNGLVICPRLFTAVEGTLVSIPDRYALSEVYPNPFNASARIQFGLPEESRVILNAYNVLGNMVAEVMNGTRPKGSYELHWRADGLPSGMYLVRMVAESVESNKRYLSSKKVILLK